MRICFDFRCTVQDCPQLEAPSNGYFVHNECFNVFNSACGIRYTNQFKNINFHGSFIKQYEILYDMPDDNLNIIKIRCNTGYDLTNGDSLRTCKPNGQWSGRQPM